MLVLKVLLVMLFSVDLAWFIPILRVCAINFRNTSNIKHEMGLFPHPASLCTFQRPKG